MYSDDFFAVFALVYFVILAIALTFGIVSYVLRSISLFKIGKRRGVRLYGLAWVPVASSWVSGSIADIHDRKLGRDYKWRHFLLWSSVIVFVCAVAVISIYADLIVKMIAIADYLTEAQMDNMAIKYVSRLIPFAIVASLISAVTTVFMYICMYKFFESCRPRFTMLYLILSIIIPVTHPFFVFACRNWDDGVKLGTAPEQPRIPEEAQPPEQSPFDEQ